MPNGWTPVEDPRPNPFNAMMDNYKQPFNIAGCVSLIFMGLVVVGFCVGIYYGFGCVIDIYCLTWLR